MPRCLRYRRLLMAILVGLRCGLISKHHLGNAPFRAPLRLRYLLYRRRRKHPLISFRALEADLATVGGYLQVTMTRVRLAATRTVHCWSTARGCIVGSRPDVFLNLAAIL